MNSQGREFGWHFEPVEHPPEGRWLHAEYVIGGTQPWLPQGAEEALVLLGDVRRSVIPVSAGSICGVPATEYPTSADRRVRKCAGRG